MPTWTGLNALICSASFSMLPAVVRPTTLKSPLELRTTLRALSPMDPVNARMAIRLVFELMLFPYYKQNDGVVIDRGGQNERIETVEHPPVARQQAARVLHLHVPLEERLREIADLREHDHEDPQ